MNPKSELQSAGMFRRFILALGATIGGRFIGIVVQVLGVAIFVRCWGAHLYGDWLVLTAIPAYLAISDLGFAAAAANQMSMASTQGRQAEAIETFRECFGLIFVAATLVVLVTGVAVYFVNPVQILSISSITPHDARIVLLLLGSQVAISLFGELLLGGFRCAHRFAEGLMFNNIAQLVEFGILVIALFAGATPVVLAACMLMGRCFRMAFVGRGSITRLRQLGWSTSLAPSFHFSAMAPLVLPAVGFAAFPLSRALVGQGIILVIGQYFGPVSVVLFSAARTMCRLVSIAAELLANSIYAEVTTAFAAGRLATLRQLQILVTQISFLVGICATLFILGMRTDVARLWLNNAVTFPTMLILILCLSETLSASYRISLVLLSGTNRHMRTSLIYCGLSGFSVIMAVGLARLSNLEIVPLAILMCEFLMFLWTTMAASRSIGFSSLQSIVGLFSVEPGIIQLKKIEARLTKHS